MFDNKKVVIKKWIAIILDDQKDVSINELTYRVQNAVGLIDRSTVLDCLREMNTGEQQSVHLPDFNDDLDQQIEAIAEADANIFQQIAMLTHGCNWHEKMALAINAIVAIDDTHTQLCVVQPKHGRYSENLAAAIALLRHLSPVAKAELAVDILSDDWELGSSEDAPSTLIE